MALALVAIGETTAQTAQRSRRHQQQHTQPQPETPAPPPAAPAPVPEAAPPVAAQPEPPKPAPPPPPPRQTAAPATTAQAPVAVKVVETARTPAELAAEQTEREERAALSNRLLLYAGLLVAVGFFLFVAFALQSLYLWLALRAIRRSARAAERNMTTAQRAFVYLGSLGWSAAGANARISPVWANSGSTPTRSLRISTNWKAWHGDLPADFVYNFSRAPDRLFLGSNGRIEVGTILIPMRDIQAAIEERVTLYVWGRATYEDMFDGTKPHFIEFCHRLDVSGATPNNVTLTFTHYGPHNRSDEDAARPVVEG
jgi:uncharacterized membrane protein